MAEEINTTQTGETESRPETEAPEEKTVPKSLFDSKISELNKQKKELEAQLKAKMTEDELKTAEADEKNAELQSLKNEVAALRTENALTEAGIKPESARTLSAAIVGADASAIVEAVKSAISAAQKEAAAKATQELLEKGSPKVQTATSSTKEPDPNIEIIKRAVKKPQSKPLSESKWF